MESPRAVSKKPSSPWSAARLTAFALITAVSVGLAACPFSYDLPLSSPSDSILDNGLPGSWKMQDPQSGQWATLELLRYNEKEYVAWSREPPETGQKIVIYRVLVTAIDGERFLNVQELGSGAGRAWSYANYRVSADSLSLRFVDDAIFSSQTFGSSDALREFVRGNLHNPRLYMSDEGRESVMKWQRATD
jgi:hypothetical protein